MENEVEEIISECKSNFVKDKDREEREVSPSQKRNDSRDKEYNEEENAVGGTDYDSENPICIIEEFTSDYIDKNPICIIEEGVTGDFIDKNSVCIIEEVTGDYIDNDDSPKFTPKVEYPISIDDSPIKKEAIDVDVLSISDVSSKVTLKRKSDSLALISSYEISSESDDDDLNTCTFTKPQEPVVIIDSNSDSDSESGSIFNIESDASNEFSQSSDEEAEGDEGSKKKKKGIAGAAAKSVISCLDLGELPPIKDLHISVKEEECLPFGKVHSIVETLVVIESLPYVPALNLDSVLFNKSGEPLGEVFDVFGPVKRPYYTIRFKSQKDIREKALFVGTTVYCAPKTKYTQYVFIHELAKMKGSDASWKNDVEPPAEFLDYSDDEQETRAKKALREAKLKAKAMKVIDADAPPTKASTFEERMNQRNTLRNQMFIRNPSPENKQTDWFRMGNGRDVGGPSSSGGLVRKSAFTLPFSSPCTPPGRPNNGFQLTPGGFLAGRGGRFQAPGQFSQYGQNNGQFGQNSFQYGQNQTQFGQNNPQFGQKPQFGPHTNQHNGPYTNQFTGPLGQAQPFQRFGQPGSGYDSPQPNKFRPHIGGGLTFPPSSPFGQSQGSFGQAGFSYGGHQQFLNKPFLPNPQFPQARSPSFQFGGTVFPPMTPPRPMAANSPPYLPPSPYSFSPNRSPQPNQNSGFTNNIFSNNTPFPQFRPFK